MSPPEHRRSLECSLRARIPYREGIARQRERVEGLKRGEDGEALFFFEHDPVITFGTRSGRDEIVASPEALRRLGIEVCPSDRGGKTTYHGPGQLVGYPIINLSPDRKDLVRYLRDLEEALIRALSDFGIPGTRVPGLTGVWVNDEKIAALGVRVSRWITSHGFALNVAPSLDHFDTIVPCGIRERRATSMVRQRETVPELPTVAQVVAAHIGEVFDRDIQWIDETVKVVGTK